MPTCCGRGNAASKASDANLCTDGCARSSQKCSATRCDLCQAGHAASDAQGSRAALRGNQKCRPAFLESRNTRIPWPPRTTARVGPLSSCTIFEFRQIQTVAGVSHYVIQRHEATIFFSCICSIKRVLQKRIEACDNAVGDRRPRLVLQHHGVQLAIGVVCCQPAVAIGIVSPHEHIDRGSCRPRGLASVATRDFLRRSQGAQINPRTSCFPRTCLRTCNAWSLQTNFLHQLWRNSFKSAMKIGTHPRTETEL